jgi:hypothetical protein
MVAAVFHWSPADVRDMTPTELHEWAEAALDVLKAKNG